ncbi:MAG: LamG domain-containing protein [Planctomycetota bacterium]|jgi:hypothetical protein
MWKETCLMVFVVVCVPLFGLASAAENSPVAWWKFDEGKGKTVTESITGEENEIAGYFWHRDGVSGKSVKFDGFTTHIIHDAADAPRLRDAFTIEAWIAPQAYPYNWCAIVNQEKDKKKGYFFGVDAFARIGLHVAVDGKWRQCNTDKAAVPFMTKWTHIAGTFDKNKGLVVYIDGQPAAKLQFKGKLDPARRTNLQIGRNHKKTLMDPETLVRREVNFPTSYSFDGLMDELKIYSRALSAEEIHKAYTSTKHDSAPPLQWRKLPELPKGNGKFGALHCKLKFYPEWDNLWRVSDYPDIVVNFDGNPYQMVFWRGTNFNMNLVTENGKWVGDQSAEGGSGKVIGCCEHMSDKQCRYAHVRMIENNDARVVVHWRYAVNDVLYRIANMSGDSWGAWADEYYYVYPDGVAVRAFTVYNMGGEHSTTEPASYNNPGERAEDNLHIDALIQANMDGEVRRQRWNPWPSDGGGAAPFTNDLPNANINIVNFKSKSKPFYIYEPGTRVIPYGGGLNEVRDYSKFPTWNHWPVGQAPSDGRYAYFTDRVASSAVTSPEPSVEVEKDGTSHGRFIMGLTNEPIENLAPIARAWLQPPELKITSGSFISERYSRDERAFILSKDSCSETGPLEFEISASRENPLVNPAFVIKNWGEENAELEINGEKIDRGNSFRLGHQHKLEGSDLIVWLKRQDFNPVKLSLTPVCVN